MYHSKYIFSETDRNRFNTNWETPGRRSIDLLQLRSPIHVCDSSGRSPGTDPKETFERSGIPNMTR